MLSTKKIDSISIAKKLKVGSKNYVGLIFELI